MTSKTVLALLGLASLALPVQAAAASQCGAQTHMRFGETRAYFGNTLGACRPGGYCSAVLALTDRTGNGVYAQQLRIARPQPGAPYEFEMVAVVPMNEGDAQPMSLRFGRTTLDLSQIASRPPQSANTFMVDDDASVDRIVDIMRRRNTVRWRYQSTAGTHDAWFALGGVTSALQWIDCMGKQPD